MFKNLLPLKRKCGIHRLMEQPHIKIHIEHTHPIDLFYLSSGLEAVAKEYKAHMRAQGHKKDDDAVKLYVEKVESGSIDIFLICSEAVMPLIGAANELSGFVQHIKNVFDYLSGKSKERPDINKQNCENAAQIQNLIKNNEGSGYNISFYDSKIEIKNLHINSTDSQRIADGAAEELLRLNASEAKLYSEVELYWQTVNTKLPQDDGRSGDRAVCEKISEKPLDVYFPQGARHIKKNMIEDQDNPLQKIFIVDLELITKGETPKGYKIIKLHHIIH